MEILLFILLSLLPAGNNDFRLQNGDLIFQESCHGSVGNSIKAVTSSIDEYHFTHVGIVYIDDHNSIFVLEATHPKVSLTPLDEYLYPKDVPCYPKSVVGRLKKDYQSLIPSALENGLSLIGKEYDYGFILGNDKYYCSELIYEILKDSNAGNTVFPLNIMTFKSEETGKITQGWQDYFDQHKLPVPEGKSGINPGAMSRADIIDIVHIYP